jgi:hypothetical protein
VREIVKREAIGTSVAFGKSACAFERLCTFLLASQHGLWV